MSADIAGGRGPVVQSQPGAEWNAQVAEKGYGRGGEGQGAGEIGNLSV